MPVWDLGQSPRRVLELELEGRRVKVSVVSWVRRTPLVFFEEGGEMMDLIDMEVKCLEFRIDCPLAGWSIALLFCQFAKATSMFDPIYVLSKLYVGTSTTHPPPSFRQGF